MGNRAVITTNLKPNTTGIYLHWNGGRDSVEGFLAYCYAKGYRDPSYDTTYAMARLCQVIANFFGGELSVGIGKISSLDCDNGDNGLYVIGKGWKIVKRKYAPAREQRQYDILEMMQAINAKMPRNERLSLAKMKKERMKYVLQLTGESK